MGSRLRVERTSRLAGGFQPGAREPVGRGQRRWLRQRSALVHRQRGRGWVQVNRQDLTPWPPVGRSQRRRLQLRAALVHRQSGRGWVQVKRKDLTP